MVEDLVGKIQAAEQKAEGIIKAGQQKAREILNTLTVKKGKLVAEKEVMLQAEIEKFHQEQIKKKKEAQEDLNRKLEASLSSLKNQYQKNKDQAVAQAWKTIQQHFLWYCLLYTSDAADE